MDCCVSSPESWPWPWSVNEEIKREAGEAIISGLLVLCFVCVGAAFLVPIYVIYSV